MSSVEYLNTKKMCSHTSRTVRLPLHIFYYRIESMTKISLELHLIWWCQTYTSTHIFILRPFIIWIVMACDSRHDLFIAYTNKSYETYGKFLMTNVFFYVHIAQDLNITNRSDLSVQFSHLLRYAPQDSLPSEWANVCFLHSRRYLFFGSVCLFCSFWFIIQLIYRNKKNHSYLLLISLRIAPVGRRYRRVCVCLLSVCLLVTFNKHRT